MRDLAADLKICNAATRGPWHWTPEEIECDAETGWWGEPPSVMLPKVMGDNNGKGFVVWSNDDAEFIANAREGWPEAIERALRSENLIKGLNVELAAEREKRAKAEAEVERLRLHIWAAKEWMIPGTEAWKILEQAEKEV